MNQNIEVASRIEREKVIQELHVAYKIHKDPKHYIISSATIQKYAVPLFKAGAEWQAKQSPWIRVKDRLPEENTPVLFIVEFRGIHKNYFGGSYKGGKWETEQRTYAPYSFWGTVTHWMPIPKFNS